MWYWNCQIFVTLQASKFFFSLKRAYLTPLSRQLGRILTGITQHLIVLNRCCYHQRSLSNRVISPAKMGGMCSCGTKFRQLWLFRAFLFLDLWDVQDTHICKMSTNKKRDRRITVHAVLSAIIPLLIEHLMTLNITICTNLHSLLSLPFLEVPAVFYGPSSPSFSMNDRLRWSIQ